MFVSIALNLIYFAKEKFVENLLFLKPVFTTFIMQKPLINLLHNKILQYVTNSFNNIQQNDYGTTIHQDDPNINHCVHLQFFNVNNMIMAIKMLQYFISHNRSKYNPYHIYSLNDCKNVLLSLANYYQYLHLQNMFYSPYQIVSNA